MPDDFNTKLQLALWGVVAGGVVSLIVTLFLNTFLPRIKRWNLTRRVKVYSEVSHGVHARCRVYNGGYWTMGQAMAYLSLDLTPDDVMPPPPGEDAFIKREQFVPLSGDQLCWSVRSPSINPMKVDIFAKERQPLSPCAIDGNLVMIPSEEGWVPPKQSPRVARVFLQRKRYSGVLKIVSADTNARFFRIEINPDDAANPLTIRPLRFWESRGLV